MKLSPTFFAFTTAFLTLSAPLSFAADTQPDTNRSPTVDYSNTTGSTTDMNAGPTTLQPDSTTATTTNTATDPTDGSAVRNTGTSNSGRYDSDTTGTTQSSPDRREAMTTDEDRGLSAMTIVLLAVILLGAIALIGRGYWNRKHQRPV